MFGLSLGELAVIALVGLLVLGPEDMPKAIRTLSRAWRSLQLMMQDIRRQFDEAIGDEELAELRALREALQSKRHFLIDEQGNRQPTYDIADLMMERPVGSKPEAELPVIEIAPIPSKSEEPPRG